MREPVMQDEILLIYRKASLIWFLFLTALGVYLIICFIIGGATRKTMDMTGPISLIRYMFLAVSFVSLIVSFYLRKIMLSGRTSRTYHSQDPETLIVQPQNLSMKYLSAKIISFALTEGIAIFGLVLFFLGDSLKTFYLFLAISAVALYYHRPSTEEIKQLSTLLSR